MEDEGGEEGEERNEAEGRRFNELWAIGGSVVMTWDKANSSDIKKRGHLLKNISHVTLGRGSDVN